MDKNSFEKVNKKWLEEISTDIDESSLISKRYETTLKLENINKIHSEIDFKNSKITNNILNILEFLTNEISNAERGYKSIRESIQEMNPVGAIQLMPSNELHTRDNNGWLICDGKTYKSEEYPALYRLYLLSEPTNPDDTFKVPNLSKLVENDGEYTYVIRAR